MPFIKSAKHRNFSVIYTIKEYNYKTMRTKGAKDLKPRVEMTKKGKENIKKGKLRQWAQIKAMQLFFDKYKIQI